MTKKRKGKEQQNKRVKAKDQVDMHKVKYTWNRLPSSYEVTNPGDPYSYFYIKECGVDQSSWDMYVMCQKQTIHQQCPLIILRSPHHD